MKIISLVYIETLVPFYLRTKIVKTWFQTLNDLNPIIFVNYQYNSEAPMISAAAPITPELAPMASVQALMAAEVAPTASVQAPAISAAAPTTQVPTPKTPVLTPIASVQTPKALYNVISYK